MSYLGWFSFFLTAAFHIQFENHINKAKQLNISKHYEGFIDTVLAIRRPFGLQTLIRTLVLARKSPQELRRLTSSNQRIKIVLLVKTMEIRLLSIVYTRYTSTTYWFRLWSTQRQKSRRTGKKFQILLIVCELFYFRMVNFHRWFEIIKYVENISRLYNR